MCLAKSHPEAEAVSKDLVESIVWSLFLFKKLGFFLLAFNMNTANKSFDAIFFSTDIPLQSPG